MQPDSIIPNVTNPQALNRYSYVGNRTVNFSDPTGHMAEDDSDGGGSLEDTLKGFKKYGKHGDKFNDYYAVVHNAEEALAESLHGGLTLAELKLLDAYDNSIENEFAKARYWLPQSSLTERMFSPFQLPLAYRAAQLGFGYTPTENGKVEWGKSTVEGGLAAAVVIATKKGVFEFSYHALEEQMVRRGVSINQVQAVIDNNRGFNYWHDGQLKQGWYDSGQKIFVGATDDGVINTVMTNVNSQYIGDLRNKQP